jgi:hypothetical protein
MWISIHIQVFYITAAYATRAHPSIQQNLTKAESSMVLQLRTERLGLNVFLRDRNVPGITETCTCGHPRQTVKHVILFCPDRKDRATFLNTSSPIGLHYSLSNKDTLRSFNLPSTTCHDANYENPLLKG